MRLKWISLSIILFLISNILTAQSSNLNEKIQSFYLPQNGLKVILKEQHSMPMVGMSLFYNVGSHDEPAGVKGMTKLQAHLFEESGYEDGTSAHDIKEKIKKLTVNNEVYSNLDIFSSTYEFNKNYIEDILKIEADRMALLEITDSSLVRSKRKFKIGQGSNMEQFLDEGLSMLSQFQNEHPYVTSPWGKDEQIDTISVQTAIKFRDQYFNPNNATLVLVGDFKSTNIVGMVNSLFGNIKNKSSVPMDPDFAINDKEHVLVNDIDSTLAAKASELPFLYAQFITCNINIPSYRDDDMIILEHVIRLLKYDIALAGKYSKRYTNKLGFLTIPSMSPKLGPSESRFITGNVFKRKSPKGLRKKIKKMIIQLSERGFSEDIINKYKKRERISDYKKGYEYKNVAWDLGRAELVLGDYQYYNRTTKVLEQLNNEDIKRVVSEYLLNQDIHTVEIIWGKKRWHSYIMSFLVNGMIKPLARKEMNKIALTREERNIF